MNTANKELRITLRNTIPGDLETLFIHQLDDEAAYMAAFVNENWNDKDTYVAKWEKLLTDKTLNIMTILMDGKIVGGISTWPLMGETQISYGIGKEYWNRGIVTSAVRQFLSIVPERPIYGRVAFDNIASANVLRKCGFKKIGEDTHYAFARKKEIVEIVFVLEG